MASLQDIGALLRDRLPADRPYVVAITGGVAAGKSVLAAALADAIAAWPERPSVEIVGTDGFLFDNATLEAKGLGPARGSRRATTSTASGPLWRRSAPDPRRSPATRTTTYDVEPALARTLSTPDVLIVEGLGLHIDHGVDSAGRPLIDVLIYLDAEPSTSRPGSPRG